MNPAGAPGTATVCVGDRSWRVIDLPGAVAQRQGELHHMPYVIRILLENLLRSQALGRAVEPADIARVLHWHDHIGVDLPLYVSRVILPDSTGVPVLQDLAALRDALARAGGVPARVDTRLPVDLVVDHSLQVDAWG
ncbi:MAG: aconitate hydratase, partial [Betaproteobacteria bacterium]|nr:aconitate hydratase [Betaproteobacteria bacterium]